MKHLSTVVIAFIAACGGSPAATPTAVSANELELSNSATDSESTSEGGAVSVAQRDEAAQRRDAALEARLAAIEERLASVEERVDNTQKVGTARRPSRPGSPDPSTVYSIELNDSPRRGAKHAKVTIVKAFEFACPYCQKSRTTIDQLLKDYKGEIRVVYKNFVVHPQVATEPAKAACAAARQGKFEKMFEAIWTHGYDAYRTQRDPAMMGADNMRKIAKRYAGINGRRYDKDLLDCATVVTRDAQQLKLVGVTGTPGFFINGRFLRGAQPLAKFKDLVDEELAIANQRIKARKATKKNYYDKFVFDLGKKSN